jgi:GNAT superfamily N-acetyltransferase
MPCEIAVFDPGDGDATMAVVTSSFDAFVAPDYLPEGRDLFFRVVTADYLRSLPERRGFTLVARIDGNIVGMCAFRDGNHVTLFFVLPQFQGKGIGRQLFDAALVRLRKDVRV